jgi:hypothetical protein
MNCTPNQSAVEALSERMAELVKYVQPMLTVGRSFDISVILTAQDCSAGVLRRVI